MLPIEVVKNVNGNLATPEEEGRFDEEGRLVVEHLMPQFGRNELREDGWVMGACRKRKDDLTIAERSGTWDQASDSY